MATIKIKEIDQPPHYLREKVKASYITELCDDLAAINGVKDWHELQPRKEKTTGITKDGKPIIKTVSPKIDWPFPPIEVARNEKQVLPPAGKDATSAATKKKLKAAKKKYFPYELIDGSHRIAVARRIGMKEIPATIKSILDPAERFLEQYKSNGGPRGLRLDKADRDNAIRILSREYQFSQKKLVEETGLDQTSISRIISGKQRREGPRKAATKKDGATTPAGENKDPFTTTTTPTKGQQAEMTVNGFVERLQICCSEFPRLKSGLVTHLEGIQNEKGLSLLVERMIDILGVLTTIQDKKFPKTQPPDSKRVSNS